jgi:hypothetical protein
MAAFVERLRLDGETNDFYLVARNHFFENPALTPLRNDLQPPPEIISTADQSQGTVKLWFGPNYSRGNITILDGGGMGAARETAGMLSVSELRTQSQQSAHLFALFFLSAAGSLRSSSHSARNIGPPLNLSHFARRVNRFAIPKLNDPDHV